MQCFSLASLLSLPPLWRKYTAHSLSLLWASPSRNRVVFLDKKRFKGANTHCLARVHNCILSRVHCFCFFWCYCCFCFCFCCYCSCCCWERRNETELNRRNFVSFIHKSVANICIYGVIQSNAVFIGVIGLLKTILLQMPFDTEYSAEIFDFLIASSFLSEVAFGFSLACCFVSSCNGDYQTFLFNFFFFFFFFFFFSLLQHQIRSGTKN